MRRLMILGSFLVVSSLLLANQAWGDAIRHRQHEQRIGHHHIWLADERDVDERDVREGDGDDVRGTIATALAGRAHTSPDVKVGGDDSLQDVRSEGESEGTFTDPVATVPEPGSLALLGSGLIGLAGLLRRSLLRRKLG